MQNRLAPNVKVRPQQSTIAVGIHPPNSKDPDNVFIILFSATNKTGTRYKIKRNIDQVFTKFVNDGKTTISFKNPQHNLLIRSEPVQLKCFLRLLKSAMDGSCDPQKLGLSSLAITAVPQSSMPVMKLTIKRPSEYPVKGLPRTLQTLTVTGLRKHSIESQILNLSQLRVLHLNNNCIERVPAKLGDMSLIDLDLSQNNLGAATSASAWNWAEGRIKNTLQMLNLSSNQLQRFPYKVVKLRRLHTLSISDNSIETLPFAFRRLRSLRVLNLADNALRVVPNVLADMPFNSINLSGPDMLNGQESQQRNPRLPTDVVPVRQPPSLWQLAAKIVIRHRIRYSSFTLPEDLIVLLDEAPFCDCGLICLPEPHLISVDRPISLKATQVESSHQLSVYGSAVCCSEFCLYRAQPSLFANVA